MTATHVDLATVPVTHCLDEMLPKAWLKRVAAVYRDSDRGVDVVHRATGMRLAAAVPDDDGTWVLADGNMVTRWRTLEDAVLYGAEPRDRARNVGAYRWHRLFRRPGPDITQCFDEEVPGWPDDPRWSALFDSTVWDPSERPCLQCEGSGTDACGFSSAPCDVCSGRGTVR
jgi:hypothetical protein